MHASHLTGFWEKYSNEPILIIDDVGYAMGQPFVDAFKYYFDKSHKTVNIKGGWKYLNAKVIILTSQYSLDDICKSGQIDNFVPMTSEDNEAIERRITHCWHFEQKWDCRSSDGINMQHPSITPIANRNAPNRSLLVPNFDM